MGKYLLRRIVHLVPTLFLASVAVFSLLRFIPGDPALMILGTEARPEQIEELRMMLGIDRPLHIQFWQWFSNVLQGNLGQSIVSRRPVTLSIVERFPITFQIAAAATLVSLAIGIPAGIMAALKQNTRFDWCFMLGALVGISIPNFWLALMLIVVFAANLGWFPMVGYVSLSENPVQGLRYITLPAIALGAVQAAVIARMTRSAMLEVLRNDYVRTARAKGLVESVVVYRHALKNAMIPVLTALGINVAHLLGGTVAIETVFGIPGLGRYVLFSTTARDYPAVQGVLLFIVCLYVLINLLVDLLYVYFDPRIRYG